MRNDARNTIHTVSELARLSGTSVRTLHHYDAIGLLKPATVGENGYRYYGRKELMRLQQILIHREFGVALSEIPALLDAEDTDRLAALREQRARLEGEAARYRRLARTIDRTIAELEGRKTNMDTLLFDGFSPKLEADYETWLIDRYGEQEARERLDRAGRCLRQCHRRRSRTGWPRPLQCAMTSPARWPAELLPMTHRWTLC